MPDQHKLRRRLLGAAKRGDLVAAHALLLRGAKGDAREWERYSTSPEKTALMLAAAAGHAEMAQLLIQHGADVEAVSARQGRTALMLAAEAEHEAVACLLIRHGADVNRWSIGDGSTALMLAARKGHASMVRLLIDSGADVSAAATSGSTVLMLAVEGGHLEVVQLLIGAGADLHARRRWPFRGGTALRIARFTLQQAAQAVQFREWLVSAELTEARRHERRCAEIVRLLEKAGATE